MSKMRVLMIGMMASLTMTSYVNRVAMSIAGPSIMKELGLSQTQMGTIYSAFLLSYALLMAPGGAVADRFGPRLVLGLAALGSGFVTALAAWVGRPPLSALLGAFVSLQLIRLLVGAFNAPLFPGCARLNATWFEPQQRSRVQGLVLAGAPVGAAITPILIAWLISLQGWRTALLLTAAATVVVSLIWVAVVRNGKAQTEQTIPLKPSNWMILLRDRNLLLLNGGYFALNYFEYIFFYWTYYYFGEVRHIPVAQSAVYTTILLLVMAVAMGAGGWMSDRLAGRLGTVRGRCAVAGGGMVLSAGLLFVGVNTSIELIMVALLALALGCASLAEGPFWASAIDAGAGNAGAASGIMNGIGNVGGLIAPVLTPWLAERAGWSAGLYFGALLVLLGSMVWVFLNRKAPIAAAVGAE